MRAQSFSRLGLQNETMIAPPNKRAASVLWLLPAEPERTVLRETIARLAQEYDAPVFEPHLTLGLGTPVTLEQFPCKALRLRVTAIASSSAFTKTLFVRLKVSAELRALRRALRLEDKTPFDPHISLLYCIRGKSGELGSPAPPNCLSSVFSSTRPR